MRNDRERGATALIVAGALLFLLGSAALAVDVSGFYQTARTDQTTADLACLAGVRELPDDAAALDMAATYAQLNWPEMAAATLVSLTSQSAMLNDGAGNTILFETGYAGESDQMRVTVSEASETRFGKVLGADSVQITQEAICSGSPGGGIGALPFGVLPGGFEGGIFGPNPCGMNTGNCGALDLPRDSMGAGADTTEENIAEGAERLLTTHLGPEGTTYDDPDAETSIATVECTSVGDGETCSVADTKTGVNAGKLGAGFRRLLETTDTNCTEVVFGTRLDCSTVDDILPSSADRETMNEANSGNRPPNWTAGDKAGFVSLFGPWADIDNSWIYYDGEDVDCTSPRLAIVPVVAYDLDWDLGDANPGWPTGKKDMKVVGLLNVIITEPFTAADFEPGGALKHAAVQVVWFGPKATCSDGQPIGVYNGVPYTPTSMGVKLVSG
jgi:hypothetical protein